MRELLALALEHGGNKLPKCFEFCRRIVKNISICADNGYQDMAVLSGYIAEDWKSAMDVHCGLPAYYFGREKPEEMTEQNQKLDRLIKSLCAIIWK